MYINDVRSFLETFHKGCAVVGFTHSREFDIEVEDNTIDVGGCIVTCEGDEEFEVKFMEVGDRSARVVAREESYDGINNAVAAVVGYLVENYLQEIL